jgi:anti-sigma factor RsiW
MNCKDINKLLTAYLDNEVTPEERGQIEAHLSACPHCREELEAIDATQGQLRQALKAVAGQATPSPQAWVGIKQRLTAEERPRVTTWGLAKSKVKGGKDIMLRGLVSRQPVWKTAVAGVLAVALIAGLSLGILLPTGESVYAQAEDIARNSQQVQAALGGGEVTAVKVVRIVDDRGTVICEGEVGQFAVAQVALEAERVIEVVPMPILTEAEEQEAINIAKADPRVQELLDRGASITGVSPMYSFGARVNLETGEIEEFSGTLARVEIELGDKSCKSWAADVDLTKGKVERLIETTP